jgi:hypothetical protein
MLIETGGEVRSQKLEVEQKREDNGDMLRTRRYAERKRRGRGEEALRVGRNFTRE